MEFVDQIFNSVREFYEGQTIELPSVPSKLTKERQAQRDLLLLEELRELENAYNNHDSIEVYDAFCDILYIAAGTILEKGLNTKDTIKLDLIRYVAITAIIIDVNHDSFAALLNSIYKQLSSLGYSKNCLADCFAEVHRSNMTKKLPNGVFLYNEMGKIIKPNKGNNEFGHEYSKPDLAAIVRSYKI